MQTKLFATTTVTLVLLALASGQDYDYEQNRAARPQSNSGFSGTSAPKAAPIAILKQINRHNEDGSYTYGYEGADGSFKIETKLANGEVKGKYGYPDDTGKVRVVEYGANRFGFQPAGEGITVAPPTLVDETTHKDGSLNTDFDNGQYYEPAQSPAPRPAPRPQQQPQFDYNSEPRFAPAPQRNHAAVPARAQITGAAPVDIDYSQPPRYAPRPQSAPVQTFAPAPRPAPQRFSFADPAPVAEDIRYAAPQPQRSHPPPQFAQPQHRPQPQPQQPQQLPFRPAPAQYAPRPQGQQNRGGILDQLAKDYALPADSAAPLHDISFGYY